MNDELIDDETENLEEACKECIELMVDESKPQLTNI